MTQYKRYYMALAMVVVVATTFVAARMSVGQSSGLTWPQTRMATVDIVQIFNDYQQTRDLNDALAQAGENLKKQIQEKRKVLETKRTELEAFAQESPDFQKRFDELMKQDIEFTTWGQYMQARVEAEHRVWLKRTYQQILDSIRQLADERGVDLVLYREYPEIDGESLEAMRDNIRRRKLLWSSNQVDMTEQVLQRLNRDYDKQGGRSSIKLPF